MIKFLHTTAPLVLTALLSTATAQAQELRLFEEPETDATQPGGLPMAPEQVFTQRVGQPAYTLRSISRFGDQYQAILVSRSGETVRVNWNSGQTAPVSNSGFAVVAAGSSSLSLMHPPGDACVSAEPAGVSCSAGNQSELRLVMALPLARNGVVAAPVMGPEQQGAAGFFGNDAFGPNPYADSNDPAQGGAQVFINPFSGEPEVEQQISEGERELRRQRQEVRATRLRQFEGERINDADVPPGMQVVRTPFGDRVIPVRE